MHCVAGQCPREVAGQTIGIYRSPPKKQNIPMYSLAGKLNNSASLHPPMLRTVNEKHSRVLNDAAAPTGATFDVLSRRRLGAQNIIKCWEKIAQEPCAFLHMGLIRNGVI